MDFREEIVRVRALKDIPEHSTPCPPAKPGDPPCPLDFPPTWNNEQFPFKKGQVRVVNKAVALHLYRQFKNDLVIEGEPVNLQDVLVMAAQDQKNLETFMKAGEDGAPVTVTLTKKLRRSPGESIDDLTEPSAKSGGPLDKVPIHTV